MSPEASTYMTPVPLVAVAAMFLAAPASAQDAGRAVYPEAARSDVVDVLHGERVPDPYRWMEQMTSEETRAWVDAQERWLDTFVSPVEERGAIAARVVELRSFASRSNPVQRGARSFFNETAAGALHPVLYVQEGEQPPRALLDFAGACEDPSWRSAGITVSPEGRYVAFGVNPGAGEWNRERVIEVETGRVLDDEVRGIGGGGASWRRDEAGFYYTRYPERIEGASLTQEMGRPAVWYHVVGTDQEADVRVYAEEREGWLVSHRVSHDGRWLILSRRHGSSFSGLHDEIAAFDLLTDAPVASLHIPAARFSYEGNEGAVFWLQTTNAAPRRRLVAVDMSLAPGQRELVEIVPQAEESLTGVSVLKERFALSYSRHARSVVRIVDREGRFERELEPTASGSIGWLPDAPERSVCTTSVGGLADPGSIYRVDVSSGETSLAWRPKLSHDPDDFELRQVFYRSLDGTRIPMFVAGKKEALAARSARPLFLYGYGAYGWAASPWYQAHLVAWMELGGLYALPGIRGGGEYGEEWHAASVGVTRQTGIDDYLAAAEFLIEAGYTSSAGLIANGSSASGVVAAAAAMQRPELFGAALVELPKLDMLRYPLFTGGKFLLPEYGSPEEPEAFAALAAYSPYHNVVEGACYPPMLVLVGEEDATSPPLHGYKFVAELQARACPDHPHALEVVRGAGHNYGTSAEQIGETWGDVWSFLMRVMDLEPGRFGS